jgi:hypothetical protein
MNNYNNQQQTLININNYYNQFSLLKKYVPTFYHLFANNSNLIIFFVYLNLI